MILWNPVLQRGWEKENLIQVAGAESLAHTTTIPERETFYYITVLYFHNCTGPIYLRQTPSSRSPLLENGSPRSMIVGAKSLRTTKLPICRDLGSRQFQYSRFPRTVWRSKKTGVINQYRYLFR